MSFIDDIKDEMYDYNIAIDKFFAAYDSHGMKEELLLRYKDQRYVKGYLCRRSNTDYSTYFVKKDLLDLSVGDHINISEMPEEYPKRPYFYIGQGRYYEPVLNIEDISLSTRYRNFSDELFDLFAKRYRKELIGLGIVEEKCIVKIVNCKRYIINEYGLFKKRFEITAFEPYRGIYVDLDWR